MPNASDALVAKLVSSLDRRTAVKAYVPPTLAAIGLISRTNHGISGSGGDQGGDNGGAGNNGGNKYGPRSHASVARKGGRSQNHH